VPFSPLLPLTGSPILLIRLTRDSTLHVDPSQLTLQTFSMTALFFSSFPLDVFPFLLPPVGFAVFFARLTRNTLVPWSSDSFPLYSSAPGDLEDFLAWVRSNVPKVNAAFVVCVICLFRLLCDSFFFWMQSLITFPLLYFAFVLFQWVGSTPVAVAEIAAGLTSCFSSLSLMTRV